MMYENLVKTRMKKQKQEDKFRKDFTPMSVRTPYAHCQTRNETSRVRNSWSIKRRLLKSNICFRVSKTVNQADMRAPKPNIKLTAGKSGSSWNPDQCLKMILFCLFVEFVDNINLHVLIIFLDNLLTFSKDFSDYQSYDFSDNFLHDFWTISWKN